MEIRKLDDDYSVSGQIATTDIAIIAAMGFKSILCNRPAGEDPAQPMFDSIAQEAESTGMAARYLPVRPGGPSDADVAEFRLALEALPKPILATCRTGNRSQLLWSRAKGA